jgi:phage major head subunit gpT-like protein
MLRANFADFLTPGLRKAFYDEFGRKETRYQDVFHVLTSNKRRETDSYMTGVGIMPAKAEGVAVAFDDPMQGYDTTYTHTTYAQGVQITAEMYEDDLYGMVDKSIDALSTSAYQRIETSAADLLNTAFTGALIADGSYLCDTTHALLGGGTEQNELTTAADLSVSSLQQAIIDIEATVDDRGLLVGLTPEYLIVPTTLQFTAAELLKSVYYPENAENAINALVGKNLKLIVWPFLTDTDAWFIRCSSHELNFFWRRPLDFYKDNVSTTRDAIYVGDMRYSCGASDFRGIYGSPGA